MASVVYNSFKADIANGNIDLSVDTIYLLLVTSGYSVDIDAHEKRSDITSEVAAGGGYATGGAEATNPSVAIDDANDRGIFNADDVTWSASTITARGGVLYKSRGGAASADELICFIDFVSDKSSTAGDFKVTWDVIGILTLT